MKTTAITTLTRLSQTRHLTVYQAAPGEDPECQTSGAESSKYQISEIMQKWNTPFSPILSCKTLWGSGTFKRNLNQKVFSSIRSGLPRRTTSQTSKYGSWARTSSSQSASRWRNSERTFEIEHKKWQLTWGSHCLSTNSIRSHDFRTAWSQLRWGKIWLWSWSRRQACSERSRRWSTLASSRKLRQHTRFWFSRTPMLTSLSIFEWAVV